MNIKKKLNKILGYEKTVIFAVISLILAVNFLVDFTSVADGDWYSDDMLYRRELTVNAGLVEENVTNFPVLVKITHNDFQNIWEDGHVGQVDGGDFLFTTANGLTKVPHEIEKYDYLSGELVAWVRLPNVSAAVDTTFYLYYGDEACPNQWATDGSVWSGYNMVHHLADNCKTENCYVDATMSGYNATPYSGEDIENLDEVMAKVDSGVQFDGYDDHLKISDSAGIDISDDFTLEAFVQLGELNRYNTVLDKGAYSLKIDPDKKIIFSGRKNPSGAYWGQAASLGPNLAVNSMAVFDGYLFVTAEGFNGANSGIYRSSDGNNFESVRSFPAESVIGGLSVFKGYLYVYAGSDVFRTSNGNVWTTAHTGPVDLSVMTVFNNYLYSGAKSGGTIYRSITGTSWFTVEDFGLDDVESVLAISVFNGELFIGGDKGKVFRSEDGASWTEEIDFGGDVRTLAVFDQKLWAGVDNGSAVTTYYRTGVGNWVESSLP